MNKKELTAYQRCMRVIEGGVPDMMPSYTPTIACEVASKILGRNVDTGGPSLWYAEAKALAAGGSAHDEFLQKYEESLIELNRALDIEVFRYGFRKSDRPTSQIDEFTFLYGDPDGIYQVWKWDQTAGNYFPVKNTAPKRNPEDMPQVAKDMAQSLPEKLKVIESMDVLPERKLQDALGEEMFVVAGGATLSVGLDEAALMACFLDPGAIGDILDCQLELGLAQLDLIARSGIKVVLGGGDMADKNGPMYSPQIFNRLIIPRLKKLMARAKEHGIHYVWRTDGNIWSVADMIFHDADVSGYGEVDYDASMTTATIREKYPDLVIWANLSGDFLHQRSEKDAYDYSLRVLRDSRGSHYFHGCSNTILSGTPTENVWAMMKARNDYQIP
ncbi:MAG: uroporphyrinogen decarboxylase family protein [Sedimentisphaeraceae bacterium JB056]